MRLFRGRTSEAIKVTVTTKEPCPCKPRVVLFEVRYRQASDIGQNDRGRNSLYKEGYIKVDNLREMAGKPLISVVHIFPTPVILADVTGLDGYTSKATMRCLQGRGTPLSWCYYFLTSSDDQPRNSLAGDFVTSHKAYKSVR